MREGVCSEGLGVRVCGGEATYIVSRQPISYLGNLGLEYMLPPYMVDWID